MIAVRLLLILAILGPASTASAALKIDHEPIACMLKDRFPLVDASIEPAASVANAQVFFRGTRAEAFHHVQMILTQGRYRARLPRPKQKAGSVIYYIEASDAAGAVQRTPELSAQVVKAKDGCPDPAILAAEGSGGDVRVYSTTNSSRKPDEFAGIELVIPQAASSEAPAVAATTEKAPRVAKTERSQAPPVVPPAAPPSVPAGAVPPPTTDEFEYQIGPNDILKVSVYGYEEASQTVLVQEDGTFMYPLIGRVKASDMTAKELERKLATMLGKGFIRNPQVTVNVQEARSRSVYILGEVARAGRYSLVEAKTILDLAARAGISNTADIQIVRPRGNVEGPQLPAKIDPAVGVVESTSAQTEILRVSMRDIQAGDLSQNIPLRPNDTVFVVVGQRVYVLGEVRSPGAFAPAPGATVEQMILSAGGFTDRASKGSIRLTRRSESGKKEEFKAKLEDHVLPGDMITVKAKLF